MQVLTALAVWLSASTMHAAARTRIVAIAAVAYSGLLTAGTWQWLDGRALTQPGRLDGTLWLPSIATLTALAVTALRAASPRTQRDRHLVPPPRRVRHRIRARRRGRDPISVSQVDRMTNSTTSTWAGMVSVDDTALAVTDTGGPGRPVVYLNGAYTSQRHWRPVIAELGTGWRHITYDERARGRSKRSADYSGEACLRDIEAVLEARGVDRPMLVGWSYGAALAVHWAVHNPHGVAGVVSVDGAYPYDSLGTGDVSREEIRRLFRRLRWFMPLARPLGLAARMTADQHAEINIEINEILADIGVVLDEVTVPTRFIVAKGGHLGGDREVMDRMRASLDPVLARNPNIQVVATVASNHQHIMRKGFRAIADAVHGTAAAHDQEGSSRP